MVGCGEGRVDQMPLGPAGQPFETVVRPAGQFLDEAEPGEQVVVALAGCLGNPCCAVDDGVLGGGAHHCAVGAHIAAQLGRVALPGGDLGQVASDGQVEVCTQRLVVIDGVHAEVSRQA